MTTTEQSTADNTTRAYDYDSGCKQGHHCGYLDAMSELYQIASQNFADDRSGSWPGREKFLFIHELCDELRARRDRVLAHVDEVES